MNAPASAPSRPAPVLYSKDHPAEFHPAFADIAAWERRAESLRTQALVALGLWPMPERTPLHPVVHGRIDREAYTIEKVYFTGLPGHYVTGNLYRPKGRSGRLPGVLCPYGHWPAGRFIWKSDEAIDQEIAAGAERLRAAARTPLQANCAMLARMGCIVFHYDMAGYADSRALEHAAGFLDADALLRLQSFMGLQTWNSIRALDWLLTLPQVDPARIAVTGSSSGGTQSIALAAVDPRPSVSFPMVMISMNMQGGCPCENAPLYRIGTNNVELAALFAPRPLGAAAADDWTHDFITRGLPELKQIWRLYGREGNVDGAHVPFGHNHNLHSRQLQYTFLNQHLRLGSPEPVTEQPFQPVPPAELSVWDDAHPVPTDAGDATAVRAWMTQASDRALEAMTDDQYLSTLRTALRIAVADDRINTITPMPRDTTTQGHVLVAALAADDPAALRPLDEAGWSVMTIGCYHRDPPSPPPAYAAFVLGYNRSVIAQRALDLLRAIDEAHRRHPHHRVHLLAQGPMAPAAVLARALAGDALARAAIALDAFDFDHITDPLDPQLLPGALKYGGIAGFLTLCGPRPTRVTGLRNPLPPRRAHLATRLSIDTDNSPLGRLTEWLLNCEGERR